MSPPRLAVIGAGMLGLAHAWAAVRRGYAVTVFERDHQACGASVRNFGLGLLLGQTQGEMLELAHRTRSLWLDLLPALGCWHKAQGSLMVARDDAEWAVLQIFQQDLGQVYGTRLLDPAQLALHHVHGLGGLRSHHEIAFDARRTIPAFARWLAEVHGVRFHYGTQVHTIALPELHTSRGPHHADRVIVCAGHDFQTLYPGAFADLDLQRCRLQMLRLANPGMVLGPTLMTGLSTLHYGAFTQHPPLAAPLARLRERLAGEQPALPANGIHLIVQQVGKSGDLIVGDSHHYGADVSPFNSEEVDTLILGLAEQLLARPLRVKERWQGVYAKGADAYVNLQPAPDVQCVAITAGVGMSIGLALAERVLHA
ncbi:TIGR03364 family FAD-dependent oxidoreductase [Chitinimonas arctica]|uniref:TIGR03364 family FAD-dependent oxidoreductase n=1 Tax=Chitinimonas arctica TaxID=2594795 RepID=A0A516SBD6_9NEIS|nr:TIGR03364 family FAD-dependent oxidoreductase [Chitinimonas arctica]QDQ25461.1 TIGR03364 family FAD-dependent oxidoreductase [Chitinimonas arctica]